MYLAKSQGLSLLFAAAAAQRLGADTRPFWCLVFLDFEYCLNLQACDFNTLSVGFCPASPPPPSVLLLESCVVFACAVCLAVLSLPLTAPTGCQPQLTLWYSRLLNHWRRHNLCCPLEPNVRGRRDCRQSIWHFRFVAWMEYSLFSAVPSIAPLLFIPL